ncbi:MAG TPA: NAD(P)-binding protein [Acetobacteraceae bacterium]|nr:NAD(P)-binding protein [Acetobacteraceae bacterium]
MLSPVIIGGGPAGAAAAALIAAAGRAVTLIERTTAPTDKLCGDFLSGGAIAALRSLDLDPLTIGAIPLLTIRLVHRDTVAEAALPFPAVGLSRRVLDEALLQLAVRHGATVRRGESARTLEPAPAGFAVRTGTGNRLSTSTVFLATGKHDLRGQARPPRADGLLGLKMYFDLASAQATALSGCIELLLLNNGYAGLQLVAPSRAVFCVLLPAAHYRRVGRNWDSLLADLCSQASLLQRRLAGAAPCLPQPLAIAGTPYGHLHRTSRQAPPGLFRLGDQACVVPSLAGDGIAIALHSAKAAATAWLHGDNARAYHAGFVHAAGTPLRFASLIHIACRMPAIQPLLASACRAWPATLRLAAALSRVAPAR